jgi:hypothetical protein
MQEKQVLCGFITGKQFFEKPLVTINKTNVDYTAEIKFLGIQITDMLKWNTLI